MKYPRFLILLIVIIFSYILSSSFHANENIISVLIIYMAAFGLGVLYCYGFTAPFATGVFLIMPHEQNILLISLIAGLGTLFGELIMFKFIRSSFHGELRTLSKEKFIMKIKKLMKKHPFMKSIVPITASIAIASPLPNEIGVVLFASYKNISTRVFSIISYILNTVGILTILLIGRS